MIPNEWLVLNTFLFGMYVAMTLSAVQRGRYGLAQVCGGMAGLFALLVASTAGRALGWWP